MPVRNEDQKLVKIGQGVSKLGQHAKHKSDIPSKFSTTAPESRKSSVVLHSTSPVKQEETVETLKGNQTERAKHSRNEDS